MTDEGGNEGSRSRHHEQEGQPFYFATNSLQIEDNEQNQAEDEQDQLGVPRLHIVVAYDVPDQEGLRKHQLTVHLEEPFLTLIVFSVIPVIGHLVRSLFSLPFLVLLILRLLLFFMVLLVEAVYQIVVRFLRILFFSAVLNVAFVCFVVLLSFELRVFDFLHRTENRNCEDADEDQQKHNLQ